MRAVLTAVIAAIEAAAIAVAVYFAVALMSALVWWLVFDLGSEPSAVVSASVAIWQLAHFVPMQISLTAATALSFGLPAEALVFTVSLAPLGLTVVTVLLAVRSGWRFAGRGGAGAWAVLGGTVGFGAAATFAAMLSGPLALWPLWGQITVATLVYAVSMGVSFVVRGALDGQPWWFGAVRRVLAFAQNLMPGSAAALPERAAATVRLAVAGITALIGLGALAATLAIVVGYVEIVTLGQGMHLDGLGTVMVFLLQLLLLPVAWVWGIAWFAGPGFAIGAATSVSPFGVLLGPLPAMPLFGAIPDSWGWAGAFAPALVVAVGAVLGGFAGGGTLLRRASISVSILVPVCAALLVGLATAALSGFAHGSIGPGRLSEAGPSAWLVGGVVAAQLAFGMTLGVFARRFDQDRLRHAASLASLLKPEKTLKFDGQHETGDDFDTRPIEPLPTNESRESLVSPTREAHIAGSEARAPLEHLTEPPAATADEAGGGESDALLDAYSWQPASNDARLQSQPRWRDRLRSRFTRDASDRGDSPEGEERS